MSKKNNNKTKFKTHIENVRNGSLSYIELQELEQDEIHDLCMDIFSEICRNDAICDESKLYAIYSSVLSKYKIMCPHPIHRMVENKKYVKCSMCDCGVIGVSNLIKKTNSDLIPFKVGIK